MKCSKKICKTVKVVELIKNSEFGAVRRFCLAALAANAAAFGRSLRWVFQGFPISEKKGAKECKSCRSRKTLQNEYLVAIVATHIAENKPSKVFAEMGGPL